MCGHGHPPHGYPPRRRRPVGRRHCWVPTTAGTRHRWDDHDASPRRPSCAVRRPTCRDRRDPSTPMHGQRQGMAHHLARADGDGRRCGCDQTGGRWISPGRAGGSVDHHAAIGAERSAISWPERRCGEWPGLMGFRRSGYMGGAARSALVTRRNPPSPPRPAGASPAPDPSHQRDAPAKRSASGP
jgi:hypothetical protein